MKKLIGYKIYEKFNSNALNSVMKYLTPDSVKIFKDTLSKIQIKFLNDTPLSVIDESDVMYLPFHKAKDIGKEVVSGISYVKMWFDTKGIYQGLSIVNGNRNSINIEYYTYYYKFYFNVSIGADPRLPSLCYTVYEDHLANGIGSNDHIFYILDIILFKYKLAEIVYGYPVGKTGVFPQYKKKDYNAASRIIYVLKRMCEDAVYKKYVINKLMMDTLTQEDLFINDKLEQEHNLVIDDNLQVTRTNFTEDGKEFAIVFDVKSILAKEHKSHRDIITDRIANRTDAIAFNDVTKIPQENIQRYLQQLSSKIGEGDVVINIFKKIPRILCFNRVLFSITNNKSIGQLEILKKELEGIILRGQQFPKQVKIRKYTILVNNILSQQYKMDQEIVKRKKRFIELTKGKYREELVIDIFNEIESIGDFIMTKVKSDINDIYSIDKYITILYGVAQRIENKENIRTFFKSWRSNELNVNLDVLEELRELKTTINRIL